LELDSRDNVNNTKLINIMKQLFSNFSVLMNGEIYVNMSEIAQVNLTSKSIT